MTMTENALVLAGGGVAGIAWQTGLFLGIHDEHPGLMEQLLGAKTTLIGTSAGATVAAQISSGTPIQVLFDRQQFEKTAEITPSVDLLGLIGLMTAAMAQASSPEDMRKRMGAMALAASTPEPAVRRAVIEARLASAQWPVQPLLITAVDAESGELRVFDRNSAASLIDAVEASCAVPGVWPTVEIDGRVYMDGGARSVANADLAQGADRVLIIVPSSPVSPLGAALPPEQLESLGSASVHAIYCDDKSLDAIGPNPLDVTTRGPASRAGREQGRRCGDELAAFWNSI